jgi:3-hydroxybutyryl-CoA dehydrogenase
MERQASISIIGAGLMGHGIAQVFAQSGHDVRVFDPSAASLSSVHQRIANNLAALGQSQGAIRQVSIHASLETAVREAHFVFECGPEDLSVKQTIFTDVEAAAPPSAILASNTSVIPITAITARLRDATRALGTHWWNPPYLIPLVEVIRTARTSNHSIDQTLTLLQSVGKTPVRVERDVPGFVGNRLQHALWREAMALVQEGICDARTVDTVVKASFGRRLAVLGPLENADLVGTDLTLAIHETLLPHLNRADSPLPLLRKLVAEGKLGMKSGEGFQCWSQHERATIRARLLRHLQRLESDLS